MCAVGLSKNGSMVEDVLPLALTLRSRNSLQALGALQTRSAGKTGNTGVALDAGDTLLAGGTWSARRTVDTGRALRSVRSVDTGGTGDGSSLLERIDSVGKTLCEGLPVGHNLGPGTA